jgi:hypothetical protein
MDTEILGTNIDIVRVQENLGRMAAATERLGCSVKPLVCLVDGSEEKCCRPHRKFGNDLQQSFYQGRTKAHGETKHDMLFTDGICVTYVGSCSQHDTTLLAKSGHMEALEILRLNGGPVICYGDQAYYGYPSRCMAAQPRGAISKRRKRWYKKNNVARAPAEDNFGLQSKLWPILNHRTQLKIMRHSRYSVRDLLVGVTLLTNMFVCLNGSQTTALFQVEPPTIEEYFRNANANQIPVMRA